MAVGDDLKQLSEVEVLYLTLTSQGPSSGSTSGGFGSVEFVQFTFAQGPTVVYRGRLRQALSGNWVFDTSVGTNGVTAVMLGPQQDSWASADSPAAGPHVTIAGAWGQVDISPVIPKDLET